MVVCDRVCTYFVVGLIVAITGVPLSGAACGCENLPRKETTGRNMQAHACGGQN